ncbi:hypothetical protein AMELA_G00020520, partial [Ameiurus melas]
LILSSSRPWHFRFAVLFRGHGVLVGQGRLAAFIRYSVVCASQRAQCANTTTSLWCR